MPGIQVTKTEGITVLAIDRLERGNAVDYQTFVELQGHLRTAEADEAVLAVVLTANGPMFSAGGDLSAPLPDGVDLVTALKGASTVTDIIIDFKKPVIAAINGPAVGFPAALTGLCDMVLVSETASYKAPFLQLGLTPEGCTSVTLLESLGRSVAMDVLVNGRTLTAEELVQYRFAARVLPAANFREEALKVVTAGVGSCSIAALAKMKELFRPEAERKRLHEVNAAEQAAITERLMSGEPTQRITQFLQAQAAAAAAAAGGPSE